MSSAQQREKYFTYFIWTILNWWANKRKSSKSGCKQLHGIQTWYVRRDCTQKRKTSSLVELTTWHQQRIQDLEQGKTGSEESEGMQHQKVKERLKKEYAMRLRMILIWQLNAKNESTETEVLDVQLLRCSFGVINWRLEDKSKNEI